MSVCAICQTLTFFRPNFETSSLNAKKISASKKSSSKKADKKSAPAEEAKFLGCFVSESQLVDRVYSGGSTGANYNIALLHAQSNNKRYFAIARGGEDGHAFAFSSLDTSKGGPVKGEGCERPCSDLDNKVCGCTDNACTGPVPRGEEHNRRWAVYEVLNYKK